MAGQVKLDSTCAAGQESDVVSEYPTGSAATDSQTKRYARNPFSWLPSTHVLIRDTAFDLCASISTIHLDSTDTFDCNVVRNLPDVAIVSGVLGIQFRFAPSESACDSEPIDRVLVLAVLLNGCSDSWNLTAAEMHAESQLRFCWLPSAQFPRLSPPQIQHPAKRLPRWIA